MSIAVRREETLSNVVTGSSIKARGNNNNLRIKFVGHGHQELVEDVNVILVAKSLTRPGDIYVLALALALADAEMRRQERAWVEVSIVIAMNGDVENVGIVVKGLLRSVSWKGFRGIGERG